MTSTEYLHLASGGAAAHIIRDTLRALGREEAVIHAEDGLAEGPLRDVDEGAASRVAWWSPLRGQPLSIDDVRALDERELWRNILSSKLDVLVWHRPLHVERVFRLRVWWRLRQQVERLHEVALPPSDSKRVLHPVERFRSPGPTVPSRRGRTAPRFEILPPSPNDGPRSGRYRGIPYELLWATRS